jgi:tRNA threonylcarbamoyladenosine biosynthesis protein TsaB
VTRLVALDTSTWWGGVALVEGADRPSETRTVAEAGLLVSDSHAVHLLPLLERLLAEAGWAALSVDAYAATRGPGSFTGIRVGLGTVRGLGLAGGRPTLGVSTLEAMAEAYGPAEADRVPLLPAGRGEVFGARYDPGSSPPVERIAPWLGPLSRALEGGAPGTAPVVFGAGADPETLAASGFRGVVRRAPASVAAAAGRIALVRLAAGAPDGDGLAPAYLRPPDAELKGAR